MQDTSTHQLISNASGAIISFLTVINQGDALESLVLTVQESLLIFVELREFFETFMQLTLTGIECISRFFGFCLSIAKFSIYLL